MTRLVIPLLALIQLGFAVLWRAETVDIESQTVIEWPIISYRVGVVVVGNALALAMWSRATSSLQKIIALVVSLGSGVIIFSIVIYYLYVDFGGAASSFPIGVAWDYTLLQPCTLVVLGSYSWLTIELRERQAR